MLFDFRFPEKIGGDLPGVHYIRDVADADNLVSSLVFAAASANNFSVIGSLEDITMLRFLNLYYKSFDHLLRYV